MKNKTKITLTAVLMALVVVIVSIFTSFATVSCMKSNNQVSVMEVKSDEGAMRLTEEQGNDISLVKTRIAKAEYLSYGVMPTVETAYTLTATITPSSLGNQAVDWSISWVDANSDWALGKSVSNYVTLTPTSAGGKTAMVSCLQAFGERIKIKVTLQSNISKYAVCMVDYAQRLESVSLNFGDVSINLGGKTAIKYEINPGVQGPGGVVSATLTKSNAYTIADNYTYSVKLSKYADYLGTSDYFSLNDSTVTNAGNYTSGMEYYGEAIYFDYDHDISQWVIIGRTGDICFSDMDKEEMIGYFSNISKPGLYQVNFTVEGIYNTYSYVSQVYCIGYTNNGPENVAVEPMNYVF